MCRRRSGRRMRWGFNLCMSSLATAPKGAASSEKGGEFILCSSSTYSFFIVLLSVEINLVFFEVDASKHSFIVLVSAC